ncbi:restriction endonuclease subunit S [Lactobacillus jensenii]|uniref:restriction endonuclease subunit S n=1 Tax=Lactobacillus jensenii TaxID=109790 RepID=UPI000C7E4A91|nr:restriction endonuclease subunit S [Lactobacillus jensenii]KAA9319716.1 restriction endonuclease subunit S [Lactobacillus jensenii]MCF1843595.1 restriction endonuclease subunit S [Lactobacillus jensenii]PLA43609.1 restriction endonuclease subunit S [Lactobacillus jensenii]
MYPKVRFRGFDEPWKKVKLGRNVKRIRRKNKNLETNIPLTISAQFGLVDQRDFFGRVVASENLANYILLKRGEFAYNKSYSKEAPYGSIKRLEKYNEGALSTLYIAFTPENINSDFLKAFFDTTKWYSHIVQVSTEGARNHGLLNISPQDFFEMSITIPKSDEQNNISRIYNLMNSLLSLQHRKMELENQTSKAIYNYLFDKNKPFYFKDNKTKKVFLKELGTTYSGLSGKNKTDFGHGKAKYITYLNVNKNTIANHNLLDLIEIDKKQNEVLNGDILFTISSETPEEVGLASLWPYDDTNIYLNSFCFGFRPNSKINNLWLAYELRSLKIRKNMYKLAQGISRYNLSKKSVLNLQVDVPSDAEQNFDSKFVKLINIQTKFLSNERNELLLLKKFLLQNLFI